ncbi:hypothetical protein BW723_17255 [Polaribacter reichenbachii]|uniref:Uncharacterized protein n=1 Tax=Polaribacter reichenbachii TaxID=996801 RepID=A0A1B8U448_9FLAO|nr:DUF6638 family protein [Polaribacter reichenbachii]APZ47936.1 hypothetical protein BW723_17255 [Polaribacter reichenbachii]AUC18568.1 hypothetical protein BTO17_07650 [Polaribacter reichenbachii]OBY66638.1 hypothetical protein LPB301_06475 [Polaribacter reichenbachii]
MDKLIKANLYRNELIPISGKLVERYNKCLVKLGFTKTKLTSFSIDGIGWSPEIAEEKDEVFYLNNGEANPHAIIITPLQKGLPIYNPFHSFDVELMKLVFRKHAKKIQNITRDSALCIDFDQNIDVFYEPLDVLKYQDVEIKFHLIDNLHKAKEEQLKLIETFHKDNNFVDENLHQKLLKSAKKYGDLRERDINLESIIYTSDSFYTKAFGGIYLLRNFITPILVFENKEAYKEAINDTTYDVLMFHISQPELVTQLRDHVIIECDLAKEVTSKRYDRIKKFIFGEALKETQHPVNDILKDKMLFKSYLNKVDIKTRKKIMSVERYLEKKQMNPDIKIKDIVDEEFYFSLHKPHSSLRPNHQDLIWKLLINIAPKDVLFWYWYDKEDFYKNFKTWQESKKDWVVETIISGF